MQKFLPLLAIVGMLTLSLGCHHTTKRYYEEDRVIEHDHPHDYDHHDNDHRDYHDYHH